MKPDKILYTIYPNMESSIKKVDGYKNNSENSSATKIGENISCGYSISTICTFDHIEHKQTLYHKKHCLKKFCQSLREQVKNIFDFEKKNILLLAKMK